LVECVRQERGKHLGANVIVVGRGFVGRSLHAALGLPGCAMGADEAAVSTAVASSPVVVWASGTKAIGACEADPAMAACRNMKAAARVASRSSGTFVYVSTDYVFDGARGRYAASDAPNPKTAYGVSKVRGEDAVLTACPNALVVRTAHVIADGCPWIEWLVERLSRGETVEAWEDRWNTPTPVDTLAAGILAAVGKGQRGIVHVAGSRRVNRIELFRTIAELRGLDPDLVLPGRCDNPLVPHDLSLVTA
jgi:dTDP-4-dehydrorhamnose reductase